MPRLTKTLSVFDPEIPAYLGIPFFKNPSAIATGPGPLWKNISSMAFCHGGSGYVISRALLKLVGPYIRDTAVTTVMEVAAVSWG